MLRENRSETDELHRLIAAKDSELITERNVILIFFFISIFSLQHRLHIEEQLRQQLDNQRRVEEMHALESMFKFIFRIKQIRLFNLEKSNSDEKFNKLLDAYNKLREEHIVVLRRV
jgi:hypothetical protein